jgi:DNA-binding winged helix-turn-helix (wHTH) protein
VVDVAARLAAAARRFKARCAGLAAAPSLRSGSAPRARRPSGSATSTTSQGGTMEPANDKSDDGVRLLCPGRFTKVALHTAAGEAEVRLSEAGNWELRIRREDDVSWRTACRGDLDSGLRGGEPMASLFGEEARRLGPLQIDPVARAVAVGESALTLSRKEFDLLLVLASAPERVFSKPELMRSVWGENAQRKTRTLDSHASRLRRKLRAAGGGSMIVNCWGVGYRLWERTDPATFPDLVAVAEAA